MSLRAWRSGSPDGHTRAFDAKAQGTTFGDGVAVVVLKRLDDALADGDTIHAVIKGTAINNDGALKIGYTAPSVERQAEVVALALADAGVTADDISYVEAQGTATELGDSIEVAALSRAFRATTPARNYCALGTAKTNIGHLDRASGVTGLIKTVESLKAGLTPGILHFESPNPNIDFDGSPFFVNTELREWPRNGTPRRAGVTSLGVGGTNAHVVVEESPVTEPSDPGRPWHVLTLSAKTPTALAAMATNLARHLRNAGETPIADVAYTLQTGRRQFAHRQAVLCRDSAEAIRALEGADPAKVTTDAGEARTKPVVFLFPGLGGPLRRDGSGVVCARARLPGGRGSVL